MSSICCFFTICYYILYLNFTSFFAPSLCDQFNCPPLRVQTSNLPEGLLFLVVSKSQLQQYIPNCSPQCVQHLVEGTFSVKGSSWGLHLRPCRNSEYRVQQSVCCCEEWLMLPLYWQKEAWLEALGLVSYAVRGDRPQMKDRRRRGKGRRRCGRREGSREARMGSVKCATLMKCHDSPFLLSSTDSRSVSLRQGRRRRDFRRAQPAVAESLNWFEMITPDSKGGRDALSRSSGAAQDGIGNCSLSFRSNCKTFLHDGTSSPNSSRHNSVSLKQPQWL